MINVTRIRLINIYVNFTAFYYIKFQDTYLILNNKPILVSLGSWMLKSTLVISTHIEPIHAMVVSRVPNTTIEVSRRPLGLPDDVCRCIADVNVTSSLQDDWLESLILIQVLVNSCSSIGCVWIMDGSWLDDMSWTFCLIC